MTRKITWLISTYELLVQRFRMAKIIASNCHFGEALSREFVKVLMTAIELQCKYYIGEPLMDSPNGTLSQGSVAQIEHAMHQDDAGKFLTAQLFVHFLPRYPKRENDNANALCQWLCMLNPNTTLALQIEAWRQPGYSQKTQITSKESANNRRLAYYCKTGVFIVERARTIVFQRDDALSGCDRTVIGISTSVA